MFVGFSFYNFTQLEYQQILDAKEQANTYITNLCSVGRKKIIYLAIPHILSANSEQAHHTLVSYLKVRMMEAVWFVDY